MQISHKEIIGRQWVPFHSCHWVLFVCPFKRFRSQNMFLTFITYWNIKKKILNKMLKRKSTTEIILISSLTALVSQSTGNRDLAFACRGPNRHGSAGNEIRKVRTNCPARATSGALKVSSICYWNAKRKRRERQCPWSCHQLQFLWGQEGLTKRDPVLCLEPQTGLPAARVHSLVPPRTSSVLLDKTWTLRAQCFIGLMENITILSSWSFVKEGVSHLGAKNSGTRWKQRIRLYSHPSLMHAASVLTTAHSWQPVRTRQPEKQGRKTCGIKWSKGLSNNPLAPSKFRHHWQRGGKGLCWHRPQGSESRPPVPRGKAADRGPRRTSSPGVL